MAKMREWFLWWLPAWDDDAPIVITPRGAVMAARVHTSKADMKKSITCPPDEPPKNGRKKKAGRKPFFGRAMTAAERKRKEREGDPMMHLTGRKPDKRKQRNENDDE